MTHGVIIAGETYVAVAKGQLETACPNCAMYHRPADCSEGFVTLLCSPADCSSRNQGKYTSHYMKRVIFIQPAQAKEQSKCGSLQSH